MSVMALRLTEANIVMIFLAGVAFVAARFGRGPAIFAAVFGVLVFDLFLCRAVLVVCSQRCPIFRHV